jgi:chemotaxis protein methyltransferase CheR
MAPDEELDAIEVRLFLEAVHARYGYDLREYAPGSIARRVRAALAKSGCAHLGELQHRILRDAQLFARVIDDLTVPVTDMFRDPGVYRTFRARLVPLLRTYPILKLWHSGCATGEEVYSTSILLTEEGLYERSQIYATDLSTRALEQARQGVYAKDRLGSFAQAYRDAGGTGDLASFTTEAFSHLAFREQLRKIVLFFQHDLVGDHVFGEMHVVFCRNVLMYFGPELRERVLEKLAESVCVGGFLLLGSAERLPARASRHFVELSREDRIYRRVAEGGGT